MLHIIIYLALLKYSNFITFFSHTQKLSLKVIIHRLTCFPSRLPLNSIQHELKSVVLTGMVFSSSAWKAQCSLWSVSAAVTNTGEPYSKALLTNTTLVPTSVIGEVSGSWRQRCIVHHWRGRGSVTGGLCDKTIISTLSGSQWLHKDTAARGMLWCGYRCRESPATRA